MLNRRKFMGVLLAGPAALAGAVGLGKLFEKKEPVGPLQRHGPPWWGTDDFTYEDYVMRDAGFINGPGGAITGMTEYDGDFLVMTQNGVYKLDSKCCWIKLSS